MIANCMHKCDFKNSYFLLGKDIALNNNSFIFSPAEMAHLPNVILAFTTPRVREHFL